MQSLHFNVNWIMSCWPPCPFANDSTVLSSFLRRNATCVPAFVRYLIKQQEFRSFSTFLVTPNPGKTVVELIDEFTVDRLHWCITPKHPTPRRTRGNGCTPLSMSKSSRSGDQPHVGFLEDMQNFIAQSIALQEPKIQFQNLQLHQFYSNFPTKLPSLPAFCP